MQVMAYSIRDIALRIGFGARLLELTFSIFTNIVQDTDLSVNREMCIFPGSLFYHLRSQLHYRLVHLTITHTPMRLSTILCRHEWIRMTNALRHQTAIPRPLPSTSQMLFKRKLSQPIRLDGRQAELETSSATIHLDLRTQYSHRLRWR